MIDESQSAVGNSGADGSFNKIMQSDLRWQGNTGEIVGCVVFVQISSEGVGFTYCFDGPTPP